MKQRAFLQIAVCVFVLASSTNDGLADEDKLDSTVKQRVAELLVDARKGVASECIPAIQQIRKIGAAPLIEMTRDGNAKVRSHAVEALQYIEDPSMVIPALVEAMKIEDLRAGACRSLGVVGYEASTYNKIVVDCLISALKDDRASVRMAAIWSIGHLGLNGLEKRTEMALPFIIAALKDSDAEVRRAACMALQTTGSPSNKTVTALIQSLNDQNSRVRESAVLGLGGVSHAFLGRREILSAKSAADAFIQVKNDSNADVRYAVASELGKVGPITDSVLPALIILLKDDADGVRHAAACSMGLLSPSGQEVMPALENALNKEKNEEVRLAMTRALQSIRQAVESVK
jgi:HEAT repeat protein